MYPLPTPYRCLWSLLGTLLVCLPLTALAAPAAHYTVLDLGPGFVHALTPDNIAVGASPTATGEQAALFTPTPQLLPFLPQGIWSYAHNHRAGLTVGDSSTGPFGGETHATLWHADGTVEDLGTATGDPRLFSTATDLVDAHLQIGYADDPQDQSILRPCVWRNGVFQFLPTLGGQWGVAHATCPGCPIVGQSETAAGELHATLWVGNVPLDLAPTGGASSRATRINTSGLVIGDALFPGSVPGRHRAFAWTAARGLQDLGMLEGDALSEANGLNEAGDIVGTSLHVGESVLIGRATFWSGPGEAVDLNTRIDAGAGWVLESAEAINDTGRIVGVGRFQDQSRLFMLVPDQPQEG